MICITEVLFIPLLNEHSRQNEYCRYRPTLIIHSGVAMHDYIHTGIVLIELLLHKGHLQSILLLTRCRSGADNEEAYQKHY